MDNNEAPKEIQEQNRIYNFEVNLPHQGKKIIIFRREKLFILGSEVVHQTQIEPIIKDYSAIARDVITVFDPITNQNVSISLVALIEAFQRAGQKV